MFEELNQHRAAVAEQIQKACEIGFTGGELEKAHKVGDIHPNGKWVWTQLPSGRYDWRVIKKTGAGSAPAAPATAQKTAQSDKKEEEVKGFVNILKQKPNERHLELMDVDELKRFKDVANKCWLDDENLNRSTRLQCKEWRDLAKKELASKDEEERARQQENEYRKQHPNSVTKNSDIQQQASEGKKTEASGSAVKMPASYEEAVKMGRVDTAKVNAYKMPTTMHQAKYDLETYRGGTGRYNNMYGAIEVAENNLHRALNRRVTNDSLGYKSEKEKLEAVQAAADELATEKAIEKRISKIYADLNKMKKDFLANTKYDFSEKEISEWLEKYNTAREPAAVVRNTWNYSMGRIGSTSATIQVGSSKEKPFSTSRWDGTVPSWRPIGIMSYSVKIYGYGNQPTTYEKVEVPIQSWDDVQKHLSDTESYSISLYKHPKQ